MMKTIATPRILDQLEINDVDFEYAKEYMSPNDDVYLMDLKVISKTNIPGVTEPIGDAFEGTIVCNQSDLAVLNSLFIMERVLGRKDGRQTRGQTFSTKLTHWHDTLSRKNRKILISKALASKKGKSAPLQTDPQESAANIKVLKGRSPALKRRPKM